MKVSIATHRSRLIVDSSARRIQTLPNRMIEPIQPEAGGLPLARRLPIKSDASRQRRTTCLSLIVILSLLAPIKVNLATQSPSATNNTTNHLTNQAPTSTKLLAETKTNHGQTGSSSSKLAIAEPQQPQSTDLSSMYVQIPIAESSEAAAAAANANQEASIRSDDEQTSITNPDDSQESKSWSGAWPKKFQIGYIKQSDLHQVLIESLKNEPFVALNNGQQPGKTNQIISPGSTKTDSSKLAKQQPAGWPLGPAPSRVQMAQYLQRLQQQQHQPAARTHGQGQLKNLYQGTVSHGQLLGRPEQQFGGHNGGHRGSQQMGAFVQQIGRPFVQQLPRPLPIAPMTNFGQQQQQQQFQFAGYPSNLMKKQPIYTINSFPVQQQQQQEQMDLNTMLMIQQQQQQVALSRPTSQQMDYYSSWKPVTTGDSKTSPAQSAADFGAANNPDDSEEGFSSIKDANPAPQSMNRHPVLSGYMSQQKQPASTVDEQNREGQSTKTSGKTSQSTKSPTEGSIKSPMAAARSAAMAKGGTKSSTSGPVAGTKRRSSTSTNRTSSSTMRSTSTTEEPDQQQTTTVASTQDQQTGNATSTSTTTTTTTTPTTSTTAAGKASDSTTTTPSSGDSDTTEPESEQIESETTEPTDTTTTMSSGSSEATTTTASSLASVSMSRASTTESQDDVKGRPATTTSSSLDEAAEVVTASTRQQTSGVKSLAPESFGSENREETTPSSASLTRSESSESPAEASGGSDIERLGSNSAALTTGSGKRNRQPDSMSDEALLAAAVRTGTEIGKTAAGGKKTRSSAPSSERLVHQSGKTAQQQQQQAATKSKSATGSSRSEANKLITKKPAARTAKQMSSGNLKVASSKKSSQKAAGGRRTSGGQQPAKRMASAKSTRMAADKLTGDTPTLSMTSSQAQSAAQTLASLLLSRCLSSNSCADLLDVCSTKQASIRLQPDSGDASSESVNGTSGWSLPLGLAGSSSLMSLAQSLGADRALVSFPLWRDQLETLVDQAPQSGYTLLLPTNGAVDRLPVGMVDLWLGQPEMVGKLIDGHILLDSAASIEFNRQPTGGRGSSRSQYLGSWQVNEHRDKMVTINGKRVVYANQVAPGNGRIHIIDGILEPTPLLSSPPTSVGQTQRQLDIMETLKQCDKFDGFVTLAEGTGLTQILKQDGPMTVFVPSNEALRKIPDDELEVIKNNSTALKEFLMYHVVNGSYFSQDLRDGQQLTSILDKRPIQVGVRVDGCSRRLVEANTSPMRRPDIVAKNGVIHILDWYLTTRDNDWCDQSSRRLIASASSQASQAGNSEPLQQVASEAASRVLAADSGETFRLEP